MFRSDWIDAWEAGRSVVDPVPAWQPVLWRAVRAMTPHLPLVHRLRTAAPLAGGPLHLFAVASLPPLWVQGLKRASAVRDVHLYLLVPSAEYWGEYRVGRERGARMAPERIRAIEAEQNPLLTALGRTARDGLDVVLDHDPVDFTPEHAFELPAEAAPDGLPWPRENLLGWLQRDLLAARAAEAIAALRPGRILSPDDDSVRFHACHGTVRQVEVLREALLELLDRHPDLEPRQILVMTPDIARFAPLVRSIFAEGYASRHTNGWGELGAPALPVRRE
jgi:exodeoxyribonuclease V gamma subunit